MRVNRCLCGSGVGIVSVRSKEMFMRFEKFSVSSSLPGLLDRLRKCCAKVRCRFPTVYFVGGCVQAGGGENPACFCMKRSAPLVRWVSLSDPRFSEGTKYLDAATRHTGSITLSSSHDRQKPEEKRVKDLVRSTIL
jgi:hypothetical protein